MKLHFSLKPFCFVLFCFAWFVVVVVVVVVVQFRFGWR